MKKQFVLPGNSCDKCSGDLVVCITTKRVNISELKIRCIQCDWEQDILEKGSEKYEGSKKHLKQISKELAKTLVKLRDTLPQSKEELGEIIANPRHPFTAALLAGLVILMMELSGFGVFVAATWVLGNLVLTPAGWVLIPVVVAIIFAFRSYFNREKLTSLKFEMDELAKERENGDLTEGEFEEARDMLLAKYFK